MAFARSGLCRIGGSGNGGSAWMYSTADATSAVIASGYFNYAKDELQACDFMIICETTGSTPTFRISYIKTNNGTTVTSGTGDVVTA